MFKRKKKKTGVQTPEFRKPTLPPPPPTSGSNAVKPNEFLNALKSSPVAILPNNISTVEIMCQYETPCGWCCKWDKKCNEAIGKPSTNNGIPEAPCINCTHFNQAPMPDNCRKCNQQNNYKYYNGPGVILTK